MGKEPYPFALGGLSSVMASCCTHPVDQTKYRLQVSANRSGMVSTLLNTARTGGILSLWEGVTGSMLRHATYSTARFQLYEVFKTWTSRHHGTISGLAVVGCAGAAGGISGLVANPCEIVLVRMCTDAAKPESARFHYSNALSGIYRLASEEGFKGLYRGVGANVVRSVLMNASQLAAYDLIKAALVQNLHLKESVALHLGAGVLAGTIATTVCAPVDVIKSRIQNSSHLGSSVWSMVATGLRKEGPLFLMRGWLPSWMRLAPNTALMFVFLEQMKIAVDVYRAGGFLDRARL